MDREAASRVVDPDRHKQPTLQRGTNDCVIADARPDLGRFDSVRIIHRFLDFVPDETSLWMVVHTTQRIYRWSAVVDSNHYLRGAW